MADWQCAAEIWTERGSTFEYPISILTAAGAETAEGKTLMATYKATGSPDDAAALMAEISRRCAVVIEWAAVSTEEFAWASWGDSVSGVTESTQLPEDKKDAWERVNSEIWNEKIANALIGEEYRP
jgi:hypothetical protein